MIGEVLAHYGWEGSVSTGTGWKPTRCPFHDDRNASASVNGGEDVFNCHTCGVKGDAVALIMSQEGLDRDDAVRLAEELSGGQYAGFKRATRGERDYSQVGRRHRSYVPPGLKRPLG